MRTFTEDLPTDRLRVPMALKADRRGVGAEPEPEATQGSGYLESAARRIEARDIDEMTAELGAEEIRRLESLIALSVGSGADPEKAGLIAGLQPQKAAVASLLERLLFEAFVEELRETRDPPRVDELLRVLTGFVRVRSLIEKAIGAENRAAVTSATPDLIEVAHDLRSPVTSILYLTEALLREQSGPMNTLQRKQISIVSSAATTLGTYVNNLIEYSRPSSAHADDGTSVFSLRVLFEAIRDLIEPTLYVKGLTLDIVLPDVDRRIGNPTALSRILFNLITNAVKFTDEGGVELAAREVSETQVEISVTDTGVGLSADVLAHMYEPFRRDPGRSRTTVDGFGLGLSICRKLLRGLSSDLECESELGRGTRFFFRLELPPERG